MAALNNMCIGSNNDLFLQLGDSCGFPFPPTEKIDDLVSLVDLLGWPQYITISHGLGSPKWDLVSRCGLVVVPDPALQAPSLSQDVAFAFDELQEDPIGPVLHPTECGVTHERQRHTIGSGNPQEKPQEAGKKIKKKKEKGIKLLKFHRVPHRCWGHIALAICTSRWVLLGVGGAW